VVDLEADSQERQSNNLMSRGNAGHRRSAPSTVPVANQSLRSDVYLLYKRKL